MVDGNEIGHVQVVRLVRIELVPQNLGINASSLGDLADHIGGSKSAACRFEVWMFAVATDKHGSRSIECHSYREIVGAYAAEAACWYSATMLIRTRCLGPAFGMVCNCPWAIIFLTVPIGIPVSAL
ncbi:hypothetical protein D3C79_888940 [compost metagenome]